MNTNAGIVGVRAMGVVERDAAQEGLVEIADDAAASRREKHSE